MAVDAQRLTRGIGARWHAVRRRYKWWQLTLFVIGVIAVAFGLGRVVLCRRRQARAYLYGRAATPVDSPHFATALSDNCRRAGRARRHDHDAEQRRRVRARAAGAIDAARSGRSISRCTSGRKATFSDQLLAALEKKQREGVDGARAARRPRQHQGAGRRFRAADGGGRQSPEIPDAEVRQAHAVSPPEPSPLDRHRRRGRVHGRHGRVGHLARPRAGPGALARHHVQGDRSDGEKPADRRSSICGSARRASC